MVFRIAIDGVSYTTESDRDIRYAIIGRVPAPSPGSGTVEDAESGLGRRIDPGVPDRPDTGRASPSPHPRRVLGWCATRNEAEVSLQKLFSENLFADLEIVPLAGK